MQILSRTSEDVTHIPPASKHNVTTSAESVFSPESTSDSSQDKSGKTHSFSNSLAKEIKKKKGVGADHGAHEALVVKYLANRVSASKHDIGGKKWFYIKIKDLQKQYPYLKPTALWNIVKRLQKHGYCEIANHNKYKYDHTFWYHVPDSIRNKAEEELRYFNANIAAQIGVPGAVLVDNFRYWTGQCLERGIEQRVKMSPRILDDLLPFSERTIKRSLKNMEDDGYCRKLSETKPVYGMPIVESGPNVKWVGPDVNQDGPDVKSVGPNVNDDTYYKSINNPLETCSKGEPAAPSSEHPSCTEKDDEPVDSGHDDNLPKADEQQRDGISHDTAPIVLHEAQSSPSALLFSSLEELHAHNEGLSQNVPLIDPVTDTIREKVLVVAARFLEQFDENTIDDWNLIADAEELFLAIVPSYTSFIFEDLKNLDFKGRVFAMVSGGTLECIIGAFMWNKCHTGYTHGIQALQGTSYDLWLPISEVLENLRVRLVKEEFDQRKIDYASRDEDMEHDTNLTPAEKARVFRNGVNAINQVGAIFYDQQHRTDFITMGPKALKLIQKLFEHNPGTSPADLLTIMHKCVDAYVNQPALRSKFKHGIRWNTRTGAASLLLFAKNLKGIVKELEIFDCPIKTFLGDLHRKQPQEEPMALAA